jgi:hypothetical protein
MALAFPLVPGIAAHRAQAAGDALLLRSDP